MRTAVVRGQSVPVVVWLGFAAFIGLGLPEATLGVTWPSIRAEMDRPLAAVGLLLGAITVGYLPTSALSGRLTTRFGAGWMLAGASVAFAAAMASYAVGPTLHFLVAGSLLSGIAAGIIDPGVNTHFALRHGTRAMNLLHASFGIGATSGPFIATVVIGTNGSWRIPYVVYLVVQVALLSGFVATRHRWTAAPQEAAAPTAAPADPEDTPTPMRKTRPRAVIGLSTLVFFVYTGLEVGGGVLAFTLLAEGRGVSDTAAGLWATAFWAGLTVGRAALGIGGARLRPEHIVRGGTMAAVAATAVITVDPGGAGAIGFPLLGVALAGIYPSLVLLTPGRVGPARTPNVMGIQFSVAAIGASGIPAAITLLAEGHLERIGIALLTLAVVVTLLDLALTHLTPIRPTGMTAGDAG
ncbi:MAG: MFS transporter [Acidimicrobiales bacterium]|nr:MFS transporter [Acidimicrobiales bacterium]